MGLAMARGLGRAGMRVAVADVEWPALEAAAAGLGAEGLDVWPVRVDVSDRAAMEQAAAATFADAMDPVLIGDMVVEAIRHDDACIFSHPEDRAAVAARHAALMASFDRWERYRTGRES
jgi:NAD(P)-dependent dehydrogenase (short-subunit alcohol dehydrogenase family)